MQENVPHARQLYVSWLVTVDRVFSIHQCIVGVVNPLDSHKYPVLQEHAVSMPTTWVMSCSYGPSGSTVACGWVAQSVVMRLCAVSFCLNSSWLKQITELWCHKYDIKSCLTLQTLCLPLQKFWSVFNRPLCLSVCHGLIHCVTQTKWLLIVKRVIC